MNVAGLLGLVIVAAGYLFLRGDAQPAGYSIAGYGGAGRAAAAGTDSLAGVTPAAVVLGPDHGSTHRTQAPYGSVTRHGPEGVFIQQRIPPSDRISPATPTGYGTVTRHGPEGVFIQQRGGSR